MYRLAGNELITPLCRVPHVQLCWPPVMRRSVSSTGVLSYSVDQAQDMAIDDPRRE
jgi:hypothetical protein